MDAAAPTAATDVRSNTRSECLYSETHSDDLVDCRSWISSTDWIVFR